MLEVVSDVLFLQVRQVTSSFLQDTPHLTQKLKALPPLAPTLFRIPLLQATPVCPQVPPYPPLPRSPLPCLTPVTSLAAWLPYSSCSSCSLHASRTSLWAEPQTLLACFRIRLFTGVPLCMGCSSQISHSLTTSGFCSNVLFLIIILAKSVGNCKQKPQ